ncbi:hypothetical protein GCM10020258_56230 [Sphingomonas yabuuchiae]
MELYEAQEYTVRPMMRAVPGVADVNTNGGLEEQFVVQPDPVRLTMHGVTAGSSRPLFQRTSRTLAAGSFAAVRNVSRFGPMRG